MKGRLLFKVGFYLRSGTNCGITVFRIILCKIRIKDLFLFFANWWFFFVKSSSNSEFQTSKLFHIKLIHTFFTVFLWNRSSRFFMSNQIYLNLIVPPRFVPQTSVDIKSNWVSTFLHKYVAFLSWKMYVRIFPSNQFVVTI